MLKTSIFNALPSYRSLLHNEAVKPTAVSLQLVSGVDSTHFRSGNNDSGELTPSGSLNPAELLDYKRTNLFSKNRKVLKFLGLTIDDISGLSPAKKTSRLKALESEKRTVEKRLEEVSANKLRLFMPAVEQLEWSIISRNPELKNKLPIDIRLEWLYADTLKPVLLEVDRKNRATTRAEKSPPTQEFKEALLVGLETSDFGVTKKLIDKHYPNNPFSEADLKAFMYLKTPERLRRYVQHLLTELPELKRVWDTQIKDAVKTTSPYKVEQERKKDYLLQLKKLDKSLEFERFKAGWKSTRKAMLTALQNKRPDLVRPYTLALDEFLCNRLSSTHPLRIRVEVAMKGGKTMGNAFRMQILKVLNKSELLPLNQAIIESINDGRHPNFEIIKRLLDKPQTPEGKLQCLHAQYATLLNSNIARHNIHTIIPDLGVLNREIRDHIKQNPSLQLNPIKSLQRTLGYWFQAWMPQNFREIR